MTGVSVYIPFKDSPESLLEVIAAVSAQSYPVSEIILVDDGSLKPFSPPADARFKVVRHEKNLGVAAARNSALKASGAEFIAGFDADIVPAPDCLAQLMEGFSADRNVQGVGGRVRERHQESIGDRFRAEYMKQDRGEVPLIDVDLFGGCTIYRSKTLRLIGGYTEMLRNSFEDFDVARRVRELGGKTIYWPSACGEHIKRDTIVSALDTLYRWSYPHWESDEKLAKHNWLESRIEYDALYYERAVSSSLETLSYKIRSDLDLARGRLADCADGQLLIAHLIYPVRAVLRDLINYAACNGSESGAARAYFDQTLAFVLENHLPDDLSQVIYGACRDIGLQKRSPLTALGERQSASLPTETFLEFFSEMLKLMAQRESVWRPFISGYLSNQPL